MDASIKLLLSALSQGRQAVKREILEQLGQRQGAAGNVGDNSSWEVLRTLEGETCWWKAIDEKLLIVCPVSEWKIQIAQMSNSQGIQIT